MRPAQIVEAVLFASDAPLRAEEIARADQAEAKVASLEKSVNDLTATVKKLEATIRLMKFGGGK